MNSTPKTSNLFHSKLTARAFAALAPALISLTFSSTAHAATKTWNGSNTINPAWYANTNWTPGVAPVDGDDLVFTGTVLLNHYAYAGSDGDGDLQVAGITFDASAGAFVINDAGGGIIKLQGDITNNFTNLQTINFPFQLNGGNRTVNTSAGDIAIGGIISQDVAGRSLTQTGTNTLTLSGANTYTGTTDINAGKLQLGNGGTTGSLSTSSAIDIASGAAFMVNQSDTVTQGTDFSSSAITGAGVVVNAGDGTLILDRANSHTGGTRIGYDNFDTDSATRVLKVTHSDALGTGGLGFYKSGTFELGADALTITNNVFSGNYSPDGNDKIIKLDLDGTNSGTMPGTIDTRGQYAGHFQVDVGTADTLTLSGNIYNGGGGGAGINKIGDGALVLSGTNTYKGATTVDAGRLTITDGASLGTGAGSTTVATNAALSVEGDITVAEALNLTGGGDGTGALRSDGNNTVSGAIAMTPARIETVDGTGKLILSGGITGSGASNILVGDIQVDSLINLGANGIQLAGSGLNYAAPGFDHGNVINLNVAGNTWTSTLLFFDANVVLGVNDAITTSATMQFGFNDASGAFPGVPEAYSTARLDLSGFDQTLASIETFSGSLGVGGDVDITGSGTLTVNQTTATEYQGRLTGGLALIKAGAGTLTLNNLSGTPTSNTGSTSVTGGTLSLSSADLDDASTVSITSGAVLDLTHSDIDDVAVLNFNGVAQANGTYDAGNSGGYITGTGSVRVGGAVAPGYDSWAAGYAGLTDTDPALDFDGGSLETGIEYVLDGDPTDASDDLTIAPTSTYTGTALEFDYRRSDLANDDANTTIIVQYGSDLSGWSTAVDGTAGVTITVTDDDYGTGIDRVVVSIPDTLEGEGKLFARLNVTTTP